MRSVTTPRRRLPRRHGGRSSAPDGSRTDSRGVAVVAAVLVVLMILVTLGSLKSDRNAGETGQAVLLGRAYSSAATAVAAEESLERKYRLQPGPDIRAAHRAAEQQVVTALARVQALGGAQDRALVTTVTAEHSRYLLAATSLFAAVDAHEPPAAVNAVDTGQVDPVFGLLQRQIYAAAARHESLALDRVAELRSTGRLIFVSDVVVLLVAIGLIVFAGLSLTKAARRLRSQSELNRHQALHDSLTGLPNRALFQDRTAHALRAAGRGGDQVAVILVDLNRFKDVNDTLGHHYGDLLLSQVAARFASTLRSADSVARFGGDEFAVLLAVSTPEDATAAAGRLTEVLQEPFTIADISLDVDASIGIAMACPDSDVDTALRHADVAMYEAKSRHVPFATYELTRDDHTVARLALLGDLRRAITGGQLVLRYQPKVATATGALHSVEALVRWQHPTRGLLGPGAFIPIAETTAVIHPLTAEILRQALLQVRTWRERGWTIPVAVNISARSLLDPTFPEQVQRQLDAAGVPADLLSLELTESAIMSDPEHALTVLRALDAMGICLSIDDFGTGYSSMAYLKNLPVRELKIDRSFVSGMATDDSDTVLVQSAVDLGHNLGMHVVAEGVEDATAQAVLAGMGCDLVQGFHIRRPVSAGDLEPWLTTRARAAEPATRVAVRRRRVGVGTAVEAGASSAPGHSTAVDATTAVGGAGQVGVADGPV